MKEAKEAQLRSKETYLDDRACLEKAIAVTSQEILDIMDEMFVQAKILRLGQNLKQENEELQAWEVPSTPQEQLTKCKGNIEDAAT